MSNPNLPQPEPIDRSYVSRGLRLSYTDWGGAGKPALVLVHGGRDHSRSWDWLAQRLRHDWHVIAPDLRGHGNSEHSPDGAYYPTDHIFDLAELIRQLELAPVTLIGHSLGGNIALRYTGIHPETVVRLVVIEGLGPSPAIQAERARVGVDERLREWMHKQRLLASRKPRRFDTVEQACERMRQAHPRMSPQQAEHLTRHGLRRNEDGSYSWKFDPRRAAPALDLSPEEDHALWARLSCPTLLIYGTESWASNPEVDGRLKHFRKAELALVENAGHWVHLDQPERSQQIIERFLNASR